MAGLYVHIPFCHSKCIYCDFYSTPSLGLMDKLLEAIPAEYRHRAGEIAEPFKTVYFGGGTPSIIDTRKIELLISRLPVGDTEEFTIEINPEDVTPESAYAWRSMGINRVSMGVQSFDDSELKAIRRRHSATDAERAIISLQQAGFKNITCDLIYGLPGQTIESWEQSLERMLSFELPHLSAYCLSYEPGTALYTRLTAGKITPTSDEILEAMYRLLCDRLSDHGYEHYEISNFAKPGMRSRHNSSYWTGIPYLGLGPGAHSFDGTTRRYNPHDLKGYTATADITLIDEETPDERFNDTLITALRTSDGLDLTTLSDARRNYLIQAAQVFTNDSSIITVHNRMRISERAWFRSDAILRELIVI